MIAGLAIGELLRVFLSSQHGSGSAGS